MEESAQLAQLTTQLNDTQALIENLWTVIAASLVLFMQAGFCFVESGSVRTKNNINVAVKNIIDMCATCASYFIVGYSLMFGASTSGIFGEADFFLRNIPDGDMLSFLFQMTFCATAATIVSGAIAERCRFLPYLLISLIIGVLIYPVFGHWVWGGGWLSALGFHDFAGSAVVHMVGGAVGLAGIQILGPRLGRFDTEGKARSIPASSMPQVAVGVVILTFGWIGFNGGSASFGVDTPLIIVNTLLAACFGGLAALLSTWAYRGLANVELILNGVLGGLVAVTANADVVMPTSAMMVGLCGGIVVVVTTALLEKLRLDDAVGAVPVHLFAGIAGILITPFVAVPDAVPESGRLSFFGVQAVGALACVVWAYGLGMIFWLIIGRISPLRIGEVEEKVGLNYTEHKVPDPLGDLTHAVGCVARGEQLPAHITTNLDDAGYGSLGRALLVIMERKPSSVAMQSWARELDQASYELTAALEQEQRGVDAWRQAVNRVETTLQHMRKYLAEHAHEASVIPLFEDLMQHVRRDLSQALTNAPTSLANSVPQSLHDLNKRMQGTV